MPTSHDSFFSGVIMADIEDGYKWYLRAHETGNKHAWSRHTHAQYTQAGILLILQHTQSKTTWGCLLIIATATHIKNNDDRDNNKRKVNNHLIYFRK